MSHDHDHDNELDPFAARVRALETILTQKGLVDLLQGGGKGQPKPSLRRSPPELFVSTTPTELIVFKGEPTYTPIKGTKLVWANNTDSHVFYDGGNKQFYFLVSGRWFRAA